MNGYFLESLCDEALCFEFGDCMLWRCAHNARFLPPRWTWIIRWESAETT
jgi:hypothetical protein